jgi:hypothetical protein
LIHFTSIERRFQAEVLGKRVVVQHIPLGGLLSWEGGHQNMDTPFRDGSASRSPSLHTSLPMGATRSSTTRSPPSLGGQKRPTRTNWDTIPSADPKRDGAAPVPSRSPSTSLEGGHVEN